MHRRSISLFIPVFFIFSLTYSQRSILDFVVKDGDTIYGALRSNGTKKLWLYEKITSEEGEISFEKHKLKGAKAFRKDGVIYRFQKEGGSKKSIFGGGNSVKDFYALRPQVPDYIVTAENDTINGKITGYNGRVVRFVNNEGRAVKYKEKEVSALRYNSRIYRYKKKALAGYGDDRDFYLLVLVEGEVNLYAHHYGDGFKTKRFYYVEKANEMLKIPASGYGYIMDDLFSNAPELLERLRAKEFTPDNMVLIVQLYNNRNNDLL